MNKITKYKVECLGDLTSSDDGYLVSTGEVVERLSDILKMYPDIHDDLVEFMEELR